jgi:hypothetical protein
MSQVAEARVRLLDQELALRLVRAPVAGRNRVGVVELQPGSVVEAGARLASIVPTGGLRSVAFYDPATSVGRVREGQRARLRLLASLDQIRQRGRHREPRGQRAQGRTHPGRAAAGPGAGIAHPAATRDARGGGDRGRAGVARLAGAGRRRALPDQRRAPHARCGAPGP